MLKKLLNEAFFTLRITADGPLLIKTGHTSISGPDMSPVLTMRNGKPEAFLPGSSLKGVFRSHIEKLVCSLKSQVVCYPFDERKEKSKTDPQQRQQDYRKSCGAEFTRKGKDKRERELIEKRSDLIYTDSCSTCRLFGSTGFIGRVAISDAYLASAENKERRDGVGIDRLSGGASHNALFELEVVSSGTVFESTVHLRNFEIWQLGMLFTVIKDMEDGLISIGSGRSRGLGKVTAEIVGHKKDEEPGGLVLSTIRGSTVNGSKEPDDEIWGLGYWLNGSPNGSTLYGTHTDDCLKLKTSVSPVDRPGHIRRERTFKGQILTELCDAAIEDFITRMEQWPTEAVALDNELAQFRQRHWQKEGA